ncbi:MAG: hypothetical protein IT288_17935 [Bdellovibrionales bacterium]|nr:hypothetical protein [Bdellovibrionales bacterium]
MLAAIKDLIAAICAITLLAYSTGRQEWLWKQITTLRREALIKSQEDWGCPSIFSKNAHLRLASDR